MCDARIFGPQISEFSKDRMVVVPPVMTGRSVPEYIRGLLNQLPAKFAVAGYDLGGFGAMELLHKVPDRVTRIALISTNALADTPQESAAREADIISCATFSPDPVVQGEWLAAGAHLDLVGGYRPEVRETDDEAIRRARVYCDTVTGAPKAAGDLTQPIAAGVLNPDDLIDLYALAQGRDIGRVSDDEITIFKSVGASLEDFAAAALVYEQVKNQRS